jgi:hypothetical protein
MGQVGKVRKMYRNKEKERRGKIENNRETKEKQKKVSERVMNKENSMWK